MKFFIDTANLEQIRRAHSLGVLDGVTTNPSLMAKENIRGEEVCCRHYIEICNIVDGDVSARGDLDGFRRYGPRGRTPCRAASQYCCETPLHGRRNSCCELFLRERHPHQLYAGLLRRTGLAGCKSRSYLCFALRRASGRYFGGRRGARGPYRVCLSLLRLPDARYWPRRSAIRSILSSASTPGADVATCPLAAIEGLLNHPLTDQGLAKFLADHAKVNR